MEEGGDDTDMGEDVAMVRDSKLKDTCSPTPPSLPPSLLSSNSKYQVSMEEGGDDTDMGEDVAMVRDSDEEQYWVEDL